MVIRPFESIITHFLGRLTVLVLTNNIPSVPLWFLGDNKAFHGLSVMGREEREKQIEIAETRLVVGSNPTQSINEIRIKGLKDSGALDFNPSHIVTSSMRSS